MRARSRACAVKSCMYTIDLAGSLTVAHPTFAHPLKSVNLSIVITRDSFEMVWVSNCRVSIWRVTGSILFFSRLAQIADKCVHVPVRSRAFAGKSCMYDRSKKKNRYWSANTVGGESWMMNAIVQEFFGLMYGIFYRVLRPSNYSILLDLWEKGIVNRNGAITFVCRTGLQDELVRNLFSCFKISNLP